MMNAPAPLSSCRTSLTVDIEELRLVSGVRVLCTARVASSTFMACMRSALSLEDKLDKACQLGFLKMHCPIWVKVSH